MPIVSYTLFYHRGTSIFPCPLNTNLYFMCFQGWQILRNCYKIHAVIIPLKGAQLCTGTPLEI